MSVELQTEEEDGLGNGFLKGILYMRDLANLRVGPGELLEL